MYKDKKNKRYGILTEPAQHKRITSLVFIFGLCFFLSLNVFGDCYGDTWECACCNGCFSYGNSHNCCNNPGPTATPVPQCGAYYTWCSICNSCQNPSHTHGGGPQPTSTQTPGNQSGSGSTPTSTPTPPATVECNPYLYYCAICKTCQPADHREILYSNNMAVALISKYQTSQIILQNMHLVPNSVIVVMKPKINYAPPTNMPCQGAFPTEGNYAAIKSKGCAFLSYLACAQFYAKHALTMDEIKVLFDDCVAKNYINSDSSVVAGRSAAIITTALSKLGIYNINVTVAANPIINADYTVVKVKHPNSNNEMRPHQYLGRHSGGLIYDPNCNSDRSQDTPDGVFGITFTFNY